MQEITIPVMFYFDEDGNKVYDYEGMCEALELAMSELDTEQYSKTSR